MNIESPKASLKLSMGSVTSNPLSDKALFLIENKRLYTIIMIFIITDFVLNELIIINDCNIFISLFFEERTPDIFNFFLYTIISMIIFGCILFFLFLKKLILSKIVRFFYLVVGILYYVYQIIIKLIDFANEDFDLDSLDIIIFIILSLTIIPKIVGFLYIKIYERTIIKIEDAKITEEQQHFIEKVEGKLDRSTTNNYKENELEKELDKSIEDEEEEEIIVTMNNIEVLADKKNNNDKGKNLKNKKEKKEHEEDEEEEGIDY